jgi:hypothetical protein
MVSRWLAGILFRAFLSRLGLPCPLFAGSSNEGDISNQRSVIGKRNVASGIVPSVPVFQLINMAFWGGGPIG